MRIRLLILLGAFALLAGLAWEMPRRHPHAPAAGTAPVDPRRAFHEAQSAFPKPGACEKIEIGDPAQEAARNVAKGDLRPFTVFGFTPGDAPGILCPAGDYSRLVSRGGTFVSDIPDACGGYSFSNADPGKMRAYNEALAATPQFRKATGCRPASYCEERYGKHGAYGRDVKLDPKCPAEPAVFIAIARDGSMADLRAALGAYRAQGAADRDLLTAALGAAAGRANWDNMKLLAAAGADVNGRLARPAAGTRNEAPLLAVFNQNDDRARKVEMARWLIARGATVAKSNAHMALTWAASSNDVEGVAFLLAAGASPNGGMPKAELDRLAKGPIESAGGGYGYGLNGFYAALEQALLQRAERTPTEAAWAAAERRKAEINAVRLYRAGGRFIVGTTYDRLHETPNLNAASILLAAAGREGRMDDVLRRMLENVGRISAPTPSQAELKRYLEAVRDCPKRRETVKEDHVRLCASGTV